MIAAPRIIFGRQIQQHLRTLSATQATSNLRGTSVVHQNNFNLPALQNPLGSSVTRHFSLTKPQHKYNKKDVESDSEDEEEMEFKDERDSKVIKTKVNSLRADLILKAGLGMARNKVENIFYESRIRVNGKKLQKKSVQLHDGDEIDVIRGFSQTNPSHLVVSRVIILAVAEREEGFSVQLRRYKSLLIENYAGSNAFKSSGGGDH
ncbi:mitochondrial transcription rescue factor 1 [Musca vetustissima]|uniref:mitochondrial transcription rescue factor 1 n=1 Tax=Musca vetustissima TaxID=27455 RepID=UPI002AB5F492|nr:mitochondrial transcription rescue factor 1 [Musca vetustissima]